MNTTTNTRVSEAMVFASLLHEAKRLRDEFAGLPHSLGYEYTHLPSIDAAIAAAEAALSAPEPAAQGDADELIDAYDEAVRRERESAFQPPLAQRAARDCVSHNRNRLRKALTAQPAQPAERVPEVVRKALEVAQGDLHMLKKAIEARDPWSQLLLRVNDTERDLRSLLAASPAPSEGRKEVEG